LRLRTLGGLFAIWFEEERRFTPAELRLVEGLGRQAAIALGNARLVEELTTREARLEALLIVNRELSCIQPVESLLARIAEACGRLFEAHSAAFRVVEGDELVLSATWGTTDESLASGRLRVTESLAGIVATTGEPLIVTDPAADPRVSPARRESLRQLGVRSFLGVPVKLADSVIGVLTVRSVQEDGFSAADLEMAKAFASQAVVALENSRLYQETQGALQELSRTKDQLVQSQKMEAIGQLAGGIAHDFNNLLTVITGRSRLVLARVRAGDPIRRDVELIDQAAERAAALTGQLLAFSRKQVLRPKPLDLNALVGDLAPILRRLIGEHIQLVITAGGELGHVMADPGQLEQVVINLVVNARDAMPHGGTVTIGTQNRPAQHADAHLHGQVPPGHYVALMVQDSGWGMDQGTLDKIFEPFFTTKPPGKGTGLGLSTVYGIVRQSGGDIGVDSTVGRGTTFTIYLPRIDEPADPHEGQAIPAPLAQGEATILLVEDDTEVRELASELLKSCGYTVLETGDPLEALVIGERHRGEISLLISDIVMPAMWGPALAAQLRRHHDLCVLYMSGYTDEMLAAQGTVEPVAPLLRKPFSLEALARAVRDTLVAKSATPLMALANQIRPG
jgi:two-component system, cell cycle sensor histidine kinase and response regulator CckA